MAQKTTHLDGEGSQVRTRFLWQFGAIGFWVFVVQYRLQVFPEIRSDSVHRVRAQDTRIRRSLYLVSNCRNHMSLIRCFDWTALYLKSMLDLRIGTLFAWESRGVLKTGIWINRFFYLIQKLINSNIKHYLPNQCQMKIMLCWNKAFWVVVLVLINLSALFQHSIVYDIGSLLIDVQFLRGREIDWRKDLGKQIYREAKQVIQLEDSSGIRT